jgi:hypothetical protein
MLALTNDHGDHSFLLINSNNTNSGHTSRLLVERAFFNDPKERCGSHPFFVWRLAFDVLRLAFGVWRLAFVLVLEKLVFGRRYEVLRLPELRPAAEGLSCC